MSSRNYESPFSYSYIVRTKGGLMSESTGGFSHCPKNVPKTILEYVLHPLHDNDKILIAYNLLQVKNYHSYKI